MEEDSSGADGMTLLRAEQLESVQVQSLHCCKPISSQREDASE